MVIMTVEDCDKTFGKPPCFTSNKPRRLSHIQFVRYMEVMLMVIYRPSVNEISKCMNYT